MAEEKSGSLFSELKRRNVFRVAIAYVLLAWIILQIADVLFPALALPEWTVRLVAGILILAFPVAILMAWAYELKPDGSDNVSAKPTTVQSARTLDRIIIVVLIIAVTGFAADKFLWSKQQPLESATADNIEQKAKSIAVLPFENTSSDQEQEYFSDGLSEELLSALARVKDLRVIGRTSSFQFKDKPEDLRAIGDKLNVSHILEGSVRKAGDRLRISARLVSTEDGSYAWSEDFDRKLDDIFAIQDSIARSVVAALKVELLGQDNNATASPNEIQAYDFYLKGLQRRSMAGPENTLKAKEFFDQALALNEQLAPAWQQLAGIYTIQTLTGERPPEQGVKLVKDAIAKALEIDPLLASAYVSQGSARMNFDWDWQGAEASYIRALEIDPDHPDALTGISMLAAALGRFDEAKDYIDRSLRVDPLSLSTLHNKAFVYYLAGEFEQAAEAFRYAIDFSGGVYPVGQTMLALALLGQGKPDEALLESEKELAEPFRIATQVAIRYALGQQDEANTLLETLIERFGDRLAVPIGGNYAFMGDADAAFEWFEKAYEQHDGQLTWTMVHPMNERLQDDPRMNALLEKLKLR